MKEKIASLLKEALANLQIPYNGVITIDIPSKKENGDYATNIALKLAKEVKKSPQELASEIKNQIQDENITQITIAGPGFINFFVNKSYLLDNINTVLELKENYGRCNYGQGKKVNVEFVSANPTGILHLGNARGGAYGDSLARILNFTGFQATKEYYVNDAGNQIDNLGLSIKARYLTICSLPSEMPENGYYGPEIIEMAQELYDSHGKDLIETDLAFFKEYGTEKLLNRIKEILKTYRIEYDVFTSEKSIYAKETIPSILDKLKKKDFAYEKENALWFRSSSFGDPKDHVLIKNDGTLTYFVPDIAYHLDKIDRGFEKLIDIFGTDHHGYVARLKGALSALGYDENILDVKLLQLVRLVKDGEEVKMSKRTGNVVALEELIEEVGINAARYYFTMHSLDTQMDFDLELAKKKSNENPVYYVCYAYARICTILKNCDHNKSISSYETIKEDEAYNVLACIYRFPEVVLDAAKKQLPHLLTNYVYELANLFHTFYSKYRIIVTDEKKTEENINLIKAVKITLYNALDLIGVIPPEKM